MTSEKGIFPFKIISYQKIQQWKSRQTISSKLLISSTPMPWPRRKGSRPIFTICCTNRIAQNCSKILILIILNMQILPKKRTSFGYSARQKLCIVQFRVFYFLLIDSHVDYCHRVHFQKTSQKFHFFYNVWSA